MTAAGPARPRRRRRWSFVFVAVLLGLVAALLLTELGFRLFWQIPPQFADFDNAGLYRATDDGDVALQPGYRGTLRIGAERTTHVAISSLGLRGAELGPKRPGERRILWSGDSLVFGYGVEADEALPACTEAALRAAGVAVVCGNAGVPGYGSKHAALQLARLDVPFGADAFVLCSFLGNDAGDDLGPARTVYNGLMLQDVMARLVQTSWRTRLALRSRAALWFEARILGTKPEWSPLASAPPLPPAHVADLQSLPPESQRHAGLFLDAVDPQRRFTVGAAAPIPRVLDALRDSLERCKQLAGDRPLVYVVLPTVWQVVEAKRTAHLAELALPPAEFQRGLAQQRFTAVARELGIVALDATPILLADPAPAELFLADGGHLSQRGNERLGTWLAGELRTVLAKDR